MKSISEHHTLTFAKEYAKELVKENKKRSHALVIELHGNLGAGKTVFARGFIRALGVKTTIQSPTFVLMRHYRISQKNGGTFKDLFHIDAYRLKTKKESASFDIKTLIKNPHAILLIEWARYVKKYLPKERRVIYARHGKEIDTRHIRVVNHT